MAKTPPLLFRKNASQPGAFEIPPEITRSARQPQSIFASASAASRRMPSLHLDIDTRPPPPQGGIAFASDAATRPTVGPSLGKLSIMNLDSASRAASQRNEGRQQQREWREEQLRPHYDNPVAPLVPQPQSSSRLASQGGGRVQALGSAQPSYGALDRGARSEVTGMPFVSHTQSRVESTQRPPANPADVAWSHANAQNAYQQQRDWLPAQTTQLATGAPLLSGCTTMNASRLGSVRGGPVVWNGGGAAELPDFEPGPDPMAALPMQQQQQQQQNYIQRYQQDLQQPAQPIQGRNHASHGAISAAVPPRQQLIRDHFAHPQQQQLPPNGAPSALYHSKTTTGAGDAAVPSQHHLQMHIAQLDAEEHLLALEEQTLTHQMLDMLRAQRFVDEQLIRAQQQWAELYDAQIAFQGEPLIDLSEDIAVLESRVRLVQHHESEVRARLDTEDAQLRCFAHHDSHEASLQQHIGALEQAFATLERRRSHAVAKAEAYCEAETRREAMSRELLAVLEREIAEVEARMLRQGAGSDRATLSREEPLAVSMPRARSAAPVQQPVLERALVVSGAHRIGLAPVDANASAAAPKSILRKDGVYSAPASRGASRVLPNPEPSVSQGRQRGFQFESGMGDESVAVPIHDDDSFVASRHGSVDGGVACPEGELSFVACGRDYVDGGAVVLGNIEGTKRKRLEAN